MATIKIETRFSSVSDYYTNQQTTLGCCRVLLSILHDTCKTIKETLIFATLVETLNKVHFLVKGFSAVVGVNIT